MDTDENGEKKLGMRKRMRRFSHLHGVRCAHLLKRLLRKFYVAIVGLLSGTKRIIFKYWVQSEQIIVGNAQFGENYLKCLSIEKGILMGRKLEKRNSYFKVFKIDQVI